MIHKRFHLLFCLLLLIVFTPIFSGEEKSSTEIQKDIDSRKTELHYLQKEIKDIEERLHLKNREAISSTEILIDLENKIFLTEKIEKTNRFDSIRFF